MTLPHNAEESVQKFLNPDTVLDHHQNLIVVSLDHLQRIQKILLKFVYNFLSYFEYRHADRHKWKRKHNLLGGGNYIHTNLKVVQF